MPAAENTPPPAITVALQRLGDLSLRGQSMEAMLQTVVDTAKQVLPGNPDASITLLINDRASTAVSTGALAFALDESQYGRGHGPCLHAAATGEVTEIEHTATEQRWADYCRWAAEQGCGSSLSVPLPVHEGMLGALNTYARDSWAFDDEAREAARGIAPYAGVAVSNLHAYRTAQDLAGNLEVALHSRAVIDQAKGILMERYRVTAEQAFQALASVSMRTNRKVQDIAEELVLTGDFAGRPGAG